MPLSFSRPGAMERGKKKKKINNSKDQYQGKRERKMIRILLRKTPVQD